MEAPEIKSVLRHMLETTNPKIIINELHNLVCEKVFEPETSLDALNIQKDWQDIMYALRKIRQQIPEEF